MSLVFNILPKLVIAFFPQGASIFNFMTAVTICSDFGAPRNSLIVSVVSPSVCQKVMVLKLKLSILWPPHMKS